MFWSYFIVFILLAVILLLFFYYWKSLKEFAPWVPSSSRLAAEALIWINPAPGTKFVDLGSGDGRIVFMAEKKFQLNAVGVEFSPIIWLISIIRKFISRSKAQLLLGSLYNYHLGDCQIIYLYGLPENLKNQLAKKIIAEVKPGTWIISYTFSLTSLIPIHQIKDKWRQVNIYQVKSKG